MSKMILMAFALSICSLNASLASDAKVTAFYEKSMTILSEMSSVMFAGEGEGSELQDKVIFENDVKTVLRIKDQAKTYVETLGAQDQLVELIHFTNEILKENQNLTDQLARSYSDNRGICREGYSSSGPATDGEVEAACASLTPIGTALEKLDYCWDRSEVEWSQCTASQ